VSKVFLVLRQMNENKLRVCAGAYGLFVKLGIKSVTMDDIAKEMAISKRTLYELFDNKNELVEVAVTAYFEVECEIIDTITANSINAIDEVAKISTYLKKVFHSFNPSILYDMKKYHPSAYELYRSYKCGRLMKSVSENIYKGIKESLYRDDIDVEILSKMRLAQVELMFDSDVYPVLDYTLYDINLQLFEHFIMGLVTPKGYDLYTKYKKENE